MSIFFARWALISKEKLLSSSMFYLLKSYGLFVCCYTFFIDMNALRAKINF